MNLMTVDHKHCTGCGACVEACPQLAVVSVRDRHKFVYPSVDAGQCDYCGRCEEVCPLRRPLSLSAGDPERTFSPQYYAAASPDRQVRRDSHAGGVFSLLAERVTDEGGVVYGCAFDGSFHPYHRRVTAREDLMSLRGVKPVQSDTAGVFTAVRRDLQEGRKVLFAGTPCQCDGLLHFLDYRREGLILVDLLCGGVTSEGIFHRYLHWLEQRLGGRVTELRFENQPVFGEHDGLRIVFRRRKLRWLLSYPASLDMLTRMLAKGVAARLSCGTCPYACPERVGDISLGRFERLRQAYPDFPLDGGASLVVLSTPAGEELFESVRDRMTVIRSGRDSAAANRRMTTPVRTGRQRKALLDTVFACDFGAAAARFGSPGLWRTLAEWCRALRPDVLLRKVKKMRERLGAWAAGCLRRSG